MHDSELHAQAVLWCHRRPCRPVLVMEGEAPVRTDDCAIAADALFRVALRFGLRLTTDLNHLQLRPVAGWRMLIDDTARVTLWWPRFHPLLEKAPLGLPTGWLDIATTQHVAFVFAGYGLGLHGHPAGNAGLEQRLLQAAEVGALASGAVTVSGPEA